MRELLQQPAPASAGSATPVSESEIRLNALELHQRVTIGQLVNLEAQRASTARDLPGLSVAERPQGARLLTKIEAAITSENADLDATRQQIREIRGSMPVLAPAPSAIVTQPQTMFGHTPMEFGGAAAFLLLLPMALAAARAMWRRGSAPRAGRDYESNQHFSRLEQAVESIAIEVERISESQRFAAKWLAEKPEKLAAVKEVG